MSTGKSHIEAKYIRYDFQRECLKRPYMDPGKYTV